MNWTIVTSRFERNLAPVEMKDPHTLHQAPWLEPSARQTQNALLAAVSHELRTPLTSITGCLSALLVEDSNLDDALRADLIANAYQEAKRLNRMIGNLLDMAKITAGTLQVNRRLEYLPEVIHFAMQQFDDVLNGRRLLFEKPQTVPLVKLDFELVARAIANVIENALEFSSEGSTIRIQLIVDNPAITILILDDGASISSTDLPFVFDNFYRLQGGKHGLGLGLAVSKGIFEALGGSVQIGNQAGGGVRVAMSLPL